MCTRSMAAPRQAGSGPRCRSWDSRGGCALQGSGGSARSHAHRHNVWLCSQGGWGSSPNTLDLGPRCSLRTAAAQRGSETLSAFCPYHQRQRGCQGSTAAARHAAAPARGCESQPPPPAQLSRQGDALTRPQHAAGPTGTLVQSPHAACSGAALTLSAVEGREGLLSSAASPRPLSLEG